MLGADVGRRRRRRGGPHPRPPTAPRTTLVGARRDLARSASSTGRTLPDIPGSDDFAGPSFHSARWDHDVDLARQAGRADRRRRQRLPDRARPSPPTSSTSPCSSAPRSGCSRTRTTTSRSAPACSGRCGTCRSTAAGTGSCIFWPGCDKGLDGRARRPRLAGPADAPSARSTSSTRQMFTDWITSQVGDDPDLLAKVVPDYPATGKRTLQDNGSWLRTPHPRQRRAGPRPASTTSSPTRSSPSTATRHDGRRHRLRHRLPGQPRCLWPMEIIGRDGDDLARAVGRAPGRVPRHHGARTSRTSSACTGPGTNLAHGGSLIFHSECQMRYITRLPRDC